MIEGFNVMRRTRCFFDKAFMNYKCYSAKEHRNMSLGDFSGEGTPGNISNPEVKLVSADGTWGAAPWESRSLPRDFSFKFFFVINAIRRAAICNIDRAGVLTAHVK